MHGEDSDCDEGDEHQEDTPAPSEKAKRKRVTKPSVAKTSVFGEEASTRTFTIPVKLAPRCLTVDVEKRLRECAEVISERAIWASRLANFVVEHFPGDFCTAFEQSNGQTFYGQLLSAMAGVKRHNPKATLLPKHLDKFYKTIPNLHNECPKLRHKNIPCNTQNPIRNQMAKDAVKHLKDRMRDKLPLFIRHNLRKHTSVLTPYTSTNIFSRVRSSDWYICFRMRYCVQRVLSRTTTRVVSQERSMRSLTRSSSPGTHPWMLEILKLRSGSDIMPNIMRCQLLELCYGLYADMRKLLAPLFKAGAELKRVAEEKAREKREEQDAKANHSKKAKHDRPVDPTANQTKKRKRTTQLKPQANEDEKPSLPAAMWVWCTSCVKYLGMVIPVLKTIRDEFVMDAEARNEILRTTAGKENKALRKSRLRNLQPWQCEVPDAFDLLPQKPRAVNFVSVSRTVASLLFKDAIATAENDAFWWKGILKVDDDRDSLWKKIVDADPFLDRGDLIRIVQHDSRYVTTKQFRRNRIGKGNTASSVDRRSMPSRIPSLATSAIHLEALRRLQIPPLVIGGFKTNGYELHLEVMVGNDTGCDESQRGRIDGFDYLHKKGFDSLRGDDGEEQVRNGGSCGKGSTWNRKETKGVYGAIVKPTHMQPSDGSRFCVVDPGQINPLTIRAFSLEDGMECASPNDAELVITESEYHRDVGSTDNKLWEMATKQQPNLRVAVDALSQPTRTLQERDLKIVNEAKHWNTLWSERTNIKYDRNRMQRRCCRDAYTVKVYKWMRNQGCTAVWFGTGACKARGHRPVPTKSMMRGLGRYIPVVAGNEWGTSSRCPSCQDGTKLKRAFREEEEEAESPNTHSLEVDGTNVQVEDMLATQPESHGKHLPSYPLPTRLPVKPAREHRCETCIKCKKTWGHDEVATINQKMRFSSLLLGEADPKWLARDSESIGLCKPSVGVL